MTPRAPRSRRLSAILLGVRGVAVLCAVLVSQSGSASAATGQPVRKYSYILLADVALSCAPNRATVFEIGVPDRGRFLARANFRIHGTGAAPDRVHGWSARWSRLGDPGVSPRIAYAAGENVCTGETRDKGMLGFGKLTAANYRVSLEMNAYRSTDCENGAVTVGAGSSLDIWVEDPNPGCVGRDIAAFSYFNRQDARHGERKRDPVPIGATPRSIVEGSLELTGPVAYLEIIGQTEISPSSTENACGRRYDSGAAWLYVNGAAIPGGYAADTYPPSGGMTHLLLTPLAEVTAEGPGLYEFGIAAAVSQIAPEPAPAGLRISGDSIVAAVAFRRPPRATRRGRVRASSVCNPRPVAACATATLSRNAGAGKVTKPPS